MTENQQKQESSRYSIADRLLELTLAICICLWLLSECAAPAVHKMLNPPNSTEQGK